jgi:O-antigen/teichoic acid export membrane protein
LSKTRRAVYISAVARYSDMIVQFVSVMLIARLLTPEEIGVFSISVAVIALAQTLREFGLGAYIVQERELDRSHIRSAFGVALVLAWTIALLITAASGPLAIFYGREGIRDVLLVLALTFLISPIGLPAQAMLIRELQFGKLYLVQLVSSVIQVAVSITLAALGFGYLSMAWASLVGGLVGITVLSVLKPDLVFMLPSLSAWRRVAAFGGFASGANLVGTIGVNMAELIIGRMLGFSAVAYYSRAMGLLNIFRSTVQATVMSVALPAFADQYRAGIDMRPDYGRAAALMTGLAWPFYGVLALLAQPVIRLLYGRQWDEAVVIAQILCAGGAVMAVVILGGPLLTAIGEVRANLWRETAIQVPRAAFTLVAALHSLEAVAVAQVAAYLVALAVTQTSTRRFIGFGMPELVRSTWRSLALTAVTLAAASLPLLLLLPNAAAGIAAGISSDLTDDGLIPWRSLLLPILFGTCGWLAGAFLLNHPIRREIVVACAGGARWARTARV